MGLYLIKSSGVENKYKRCVYQGAIEVSMNKLSNITKQMVNQPTQLGSTGVGGSASISKWATVTKYLGLGLLVLAIMATAIMNAVGGGAF